MIDDDAFFWCDSLTEKVEKEAEFPLFYPSPLLSTIDQDVDALRNRLVHVENDCKEFGNCVDAMNTNIAIFMDVVKRLELVEGKLKAALLRSDSDVENWDFGPYKVYAFQAKKEWAAGAKRVKNLADVPLKCMVYLTERKAVVALINCSKYHIYYTHKGTFGTFPFIAESDSLVKLLENIEVKTGRRFLRNENE